MTSIRFQGPATPFKHSPKWKAFIMGLQPLKGTEWETPFQGDPKKTKARDELKEVIRAKLARIWKPYCIYCGWSDEIVGGLEREHIARKSRDKYPQFTFEPANLVLACHTCNSRRKGKRDVVVKSGNTYKKFEFLIIHAYFDDRNEHIAFRVKGERSRVVAKPLSAKGKQTIKMFALNDPHQIASRGDQVDRSRLDRRLTRVGRERAQRISSRFYGPAS